RNPFLDASVCVKSRPFMELSDERSWLASAIAGEPEAFARLYDCYQRPVFTLCYRLVGNEDDAHDAMQAAFTKAFRGLSRFRGECRLKTWLYRIAVNESTTLLRKRRANHDRAIEEYRNDLALDGSSMTNRAAVQDALVRM